MKVLVGWLGTKFWRTMDFGSHEGRDPCTHSHTQYNTDSLQYNIIIHATTTIKYTRTQQYISGTVLYTRAEVHAHTQYNIQRLTTLYNARTKVHKERDDKM